MKTIPLTQGKIAIVDDEDFDVLSKHKWKYGDNEYPYAHRRAHRDGKQVSIAMHQEILPVPLGMLVDHKNGHTLDNRRSNLRAADATQNQANSKRSVRNTSGYKGVSFHVGKWRAQIMHHGTSIHLGRFTEIYDAAKAYDQAARRLFGEFAKCNFAASEVENA